MVLAANGRGGFLATCALRPSAIFGEGDALLLPTLVKRAKQGKMKVRNRHVDGVLSVEDCRAVHDWKRREHV